MASGNNDDMRFEHGEESLLNCPSSQMNTIPLSDKIDGMAMNSISMYNKPSNASDPFIDSGWHPIVSLSQSERLEGSSPMVSHTEFTNSHYPLSMANQGITVTSHFSQYQSDPSFVELVPNFPGLDSGNLFEMVGPFSQIFHQGGNERAATNSSQSCDDYRICDGVVGALPKRKSQKRVKESNSPLRSYQNADEEPHNDACGKSSDVPKKQDGKKPRPEQNPGANPVRQAANRANDSSQTAEATKEICIHVRAKGGQATNSHSLAERIRREKISERMRLLQELVPGCNKIIGKAVMLDEIINYVQSLQQQVEFLSMKLATVNPEINIDLERIVSKDVLFSRHGGIELSPGINISHPFSSGIILGTISGIRSANQQFQPLPQTLQENELQNLCSYRI